MPKAKKESNAPLGMEAELFRSADKLRGSMEPSEYKHVVLGLIFLKSIRDSFEAMHAELLEKRGESAAEDKDRYTAENIFWVPRGARWTQLLANAKQPDIGCRIDDAMIAIERATVTLSASLIRQLAPIVYQRRLHKPAYKRSTLVTEALNACLVTLSIGARG